MKKVFLFALLASILSVGSEAQTKKELRKKFIADYKTLPVSVAGFNSEAPIELITGNTNQAISFLTINPENILDNPVGSLTVNVASIKTGIELRDKYLRETYMNTDKFPVTMFTLKSINEPSDKNLVKAGRLTCTVTGDLMLHGVTKEITVPMTFIYIPEEEAIKNELKGNIIKYAAEFRVRLADYNIEIPTVRNQRISKEVKIFAVVVCSDKENALQVK